MKIKMEVRCCCVPKKVLGWLLVPLEFLGEREITFPVGSLTSFLFNEGDQQESLRTVTLPFQTIRDAEPFFGKEYLAIKSNETPIEVLRKIDGFVENI